MYATVDRMKKLVPAVNSLTTVTSADLAAYAADSDALVNAKIARLYTVPVSGCALLEMISTDIAVYRLLSRRIFTQDSANKSAWVDKYKEALDLLNEVSSGNLILTNSAGTIIEATSGEMDIPWSNTMGYQPTFTEDEDYLNQVDVDKIDAIRGERL